MKKISGVVIVYNEEKHISACLQSLQCVADEIIIVDSFSTDKTVALCKQFTSHIYQQHFEGFGKQKQDTISHASHEWILQIDADEILSPALIEEIKQWKSKEVETFAAYSIPFNFFFLGKHMRFGGCAPEYHIRLFNKKHASYGGKKIHEGIKVEGTVGKMHNPIFHYSYDTLYEYLDKCNRYTTLIAQEKYEKNHRFHLWQIGRLPFEFIVRYIIKLGFLDGLPGLIYALLSSYYALMKHLKLLDVQKKATKRLGD